MSLGATRFSIAEIFRFQAIVCVLFDVDCAHLHRIEFGEGSFVNEKSSKARLTLQNLPQLDEVLFRSASFLYCHELLLSSTLLFMFYRSDCPALQDPTRVLVEDRCFFFLTRLVLSQINPLVESIFYQKRNVIPRITRRSLSVFSNTFTHYIKINILTK